MNNIIDECIDTMKVIDIQEYNNMTVIGIKSDHSRPTDLMPLDIGLKMGLVEITEVDEGGSVGQLKVINRAVTPLLLMDGEEIKGAKQNRIINATMIIPAKSKKIINVSCSEAGRWHYNSQKFKHSNHIASSNVRRGKQESVNNSLRNNNEKISNQNRVWENISQTQQSLNVKSKTSAQQDTYISLEKEIDKYLKHFPLQEEQNASIIVINNQIIGMELLYNTERYSQYHRKYMESYILDAIAQKDIKYNESIDADKLMEDFIERMTISRVEEYKEGKSYDYRLEDEEITGSIIYYDDNLVNASILRKQDATTT